MFNALEQLWNFYGEKKMYSKCILTVQIAYLYTFSVRFHRIRKKSRDIFFLMLHCSTWSIAQIKSFFYYKIVVKLTYVLMLLTNSNSKLVVLHVITQITASYFQ